MFDAKAKDSDYIYSAEDVLMLVNAHFLDKDFTLDDHWKPEIINICPYQEGKTYQEKYKEYQLKGHSTKETFGFLLLSSAQSEPSHLTCSYMKRYKNYSWWPSETLGKYDQGVTLFKAPDPLMKLAEIKHLRTPKLLVFKVALGRQKIKICSLDQITPQNEEPDNNYDSLEIELDTDVDLKYLDLSLQLQLSELFLYDYEYIKRKPSSVVMLSSHPRQIHPVAIISFRACKTYILPKPVKQKQVIRKRRILPYGTIEIKNCPSSSRGRKKARILPKPSRINAALHDIHLAAFPNLCHPEIPYSNTIVQPRRMFVNQPEQPISYPVSHLSVSQVPAPATRFKTTNSIIQCEKVDLLNKGTSNYSSNPANFELCTRAIDYPSQGKLNDSTANNKKFPVSRDSLPDLVQNSQACDDPPKDLPENPNHFELPVISNQYEIPSTSHPLEPSQDGIEEFLQDLNNRSLLSLCKDAGLVPESSNSLSEQHTHSVCPYSRATFDSPPYPVVVSQVHPTANQKVNTNKRMCVNNARLLNHNAVEQSGGNNLFDLDMTASSGDTTTHEECYQVKATHLNVLYQPTRVDFRGSDESRRISSGEEKLSLNGLGNSVNFSSFTDDRTTDPPTCSEVAVRSETPHPDSSKAFSSKKCSNDPDFSTRMNKLKKRLLKLSLTEAGNGLSECIDSNSNRILSCNSKSTALVETARKTPAALLKLASESRRQKQIRINKWMSRPGNVIVRYPTKYTTIKEMDSVSVTTACPNVEVRKGGCRNLNKKPSKFKRTNNLKKTRSKASSSASNKSLKMSVKKSRSSSCLVELPPVVNRHIEESHALYAVKSLCNIQDAGSFYSNNANKRKLGRNRDGDGIETAI